MQMRETSKSLYQAGYTASLFSLWIIHDGIEQIDKP